ncbi:MAG: 50S ribosomal protein L11 methyltransferase [Deltaproteobacteria bacterium]|jgi:ribosomal protein L11 methyltransferase|nr:50S ribosomal protein L11 methyltransferase [Deltaproteobacteria bacterium]
MEDWLQVTVTLPPIAAEAVSSALFELGSGGVWEDLPDAQGRVVLRSGFPQDSQLRLMADLPTALTNICQAMGTTLADFTLVLELKPGENYAESWKKDLKPLKISPHLIISPSWWTEPISNEENSKVLRLDPGSAFGSGHHATTFLCLKLLDHLAAVEPMGRILDLGAGSGVLALSAALLLPKADIKCLDNDPETLFAAQKNIAQNNLNDRLEAQIGNLSDIDGLFDLIMANLTRNTLLELAVQIAAKSNDHGKLIISGILADQAPDVIKGFQNQGFSPIRHLGREEWSALLLVKGRQESPLPEREIVPEEEKEEEHGEEHEEEQKEEQEEK